jgi:uncharacterized protein YjbI with pentapeptide repeats
MVKVPSVRAAKRGPRRTGVIRKASATKEPVGAEPAAKSVGLDPTTPEWIVREVSFATYKKQDEANASRLAESLALLEGGVEKWNRWRAAHARFRPYLSNANLSQTNKHIADLDGIDLSNAELSDADFEGMSLDNANLTDAVLERANFTDAGLNGADLTQANLRWTNFTEAHLGFATFDDADMTRANLCDAEIWNASLQGTNLTAAILERVEASGIHAMGANLTFARLLDADLSDADLSDANLSYATLVGTNLEGATLTGCNVYGISVWDVNLDKAQQSRLVIVGQDNRSPVMVDDIEVAQFVHLLLNHRKLRKAIDAVAERGVLILGRFSAGGLEVLELLAARLRELNYLPIIFDFDRPSDRNYTETIMTLAGLSRFVVADLSGSSVPQELHATVPHFKIPFVPILQAGSVSYAMFVDILEYPWVIKPVVEFKDKDHLKHLVKEKIVAAAEQKHRDRRARLRELFQPRT